MADEEPLTRLDPDAAAAARGRTDDAGDEVGVDPATAARVDVRRYRWAIGAIGLTLLVVFSIVQLTRHGSSGAGVPAGARLHPFAAPLATSDLQGDPNLRPRCTVAGHDPRALNLCLDVRRSAVVLAFFVPQSRACVRQIDALQALSARYPSSRVQFLAVAVGVSHAAAARLVRRHGWTIPVAYDADGAVGGQYGVVACPLAELAARGGIVRDRLIGDRWQTASALAPDVNRLVDAG